MGWSGGATLGRTVAMTRTRLLALAVLAAACTTDDGPATQFRIDPVCIDDGTTPDAAWVCAEPLVIDCNDASVPDQIYVEVDDGACGGLDLQAIDTPEGIGEHEIVVIDANSGDSVCQTTLTIEDAVAPVFTTVDVPLWPPNHKLHTIDVVEDCIDTIDECDPDWTAAIDYVSSDEPDDELGDGHTAGDAVLVSTTAASVRAERQGGGNGRVYNVGFTVTDSSGNATAGVCRVLVVHDQGKGEATDDGEVWRIEP